MKTFIALILSSLALALGAVAEDGLRRFSELKQRLIQSLQGMRRRETARRRMLTEHLVAAQGCNLASPTLMPDWKRA